MVSRLEKWRKYLPFFYILVVVAIIFLGVHYYQKYEIQKALAQGWVAPTGWNCPSDHPIKANLRSMIYHLPGDPYWNRTDAMNGECFDTPQHAEQQGFRASYGTPRIITASPTSNGPYEGGNAPDGSFCTYGYNSRTKACCDEDDYSCEVQDRAPQGATAVCVDGTYSVSQNPTYDCSEHGGVQTDPQYTPFVN